MSKYRLETLLPALRLFIRARNEAIKGGFTDNGGAIHSVERILDILCQRIRYAHLCHINSLKKDRTAEISVAAYEARKCGKPVQIEHFNPQRAYARKIIDLVGGGASDADLIEHIRTTYRLALLTKDERRTLGRKNRSEIDPERFDGIEFHNLGA